MKTCRICKSKFVPTYSSLQVTCSPKCAIEHSKKLKEKNEKIEMRERKERLLSLKDYVKLCQISFNTFIRERDKGKQCISCPTILQGKYDAGHFYNCHGHPSLRFDENNVFGQCVFCNQHKHGNLIEYRKGLIERIGIERFEELESKAKAFHKFTVDEVKLLTLRYKTKLKEMRK